MICLYLLSIKTLSIDTLLAIEDWNFCLGILFAVSLIFIGISQSKRLHKIHKASVVIDLGWRDISMSQVFIFFLVFLAFFSPTNFTYTNFSGLEF